MAATKTAESETPTFTVLAPATGAVVGEYPLMDADAVAEVAATARDARRGWADLGFDGRARVLGRFRRRLVDHQDLMVETMIAETGKTHEDAASDLLLVVGWLHHWARTAADLLADQPISTSSPFLVGRRNFIAYRPRGVVGVIGPWNVPLSLTVGDAIPALMAGNTVIIKPSEVTPASAVLAQKLFLESGGPEGVLNVVTGDGATTGTALVDNVDYVQFTGSVRTGKKIAKRCIDRMIGYSLELGGKDAMIVLADANLDRAANAAVQYGFFNTGQICMSAERVYVERSVHDEFVAKVVGKVKQLRQGAPAGPGSVDVTVMIHPPQRDIVEAHVRDAVRKGATVLTGGTSTTGPGHYYSPTVLTNVTHEMKCMTEETFGPTLPIMAVGSVEEAIELANDSPYGLTASVFTSDLARGEAVARRLEAGTVTVNDMMVHLSAGELPMGGHKSSGTGVRNGAEGIRKFCTQTVIQVPRMAPSNEPHWFPYTKTTTRILSGLSKVLYGRPDVSLNPLESRPVTAMKHWFDRLTADRNDR
ncbi:MAG: aldehyde dehydrogenase family protein [Nitriliruptorales bacterium]|nr:aldehyde dehydrogenase family protein [Nitriliruptorales bacterium]